MGQHVQSATTIAKPYQKKTNTRSWTLWRRVLETVLTNNRLKKKLGMWTKNHSHYGHWKSYQETNQRVYAKRTLDDKEWQVYEIRDSSSQLTWI